MHTVVETPSYLAAAKQAGISDATRAAIVDTFAKDGAAGAPMAGTGGFRKLRVAAEGRGKSGSFRVITFFSGPHIPVFLITAFAKNEADNLSKADRNALAKMAKALVDSYAAKGASRKGKQR